MVIAFSTRATWEYETKEDRKLPKEQRTVFLLRELSLREQMALEVFGDEQRTQRRIEALRAALTGWNNLADEDGKPVPFDLKPDAEFVLGRETRPVRDECLAKLPGLLRWEIGDAIFGRGLLTAEDRKNSPTPQQSPSTPNSTTTA